MRYYAIVWTDGSWEQTASVMAFSSKKDRAEFREHCPIRFEFCDSKKAKKLVAEGRNIRHGNKVDVPNELT